MGESKSSTIGGQSSKGDTSTAHNPLDLTSIDNVGRSIDNAGRSSDIKSYDVGSYLGKYQIIGYLGRGGMGVVYRGFDPLVERDVALKVLPSALSVDTVARQRFLAEARAVGKLIHPNATALYEVGETGGAFFLAMEFVGGGSVSSLLNEQHLRPERATRYLAELCFGLAAAHEVGLIHRDIKPENLLRTMRDHLKITDFGLAKVMDALSNSSIKLTNPGSMLGTPLYMSPEQFSGQPVDARCDLYSAGATYFHMLTGKAPYSESENLTQLMYAHCEKPVPDVRQICPNLPSGCHDIIAKAMAKKPRDRFDSADDMAHEAMKLMEQFCGENPAAATEFQLVDNGAASRLNGSGIRPKALTIWLLEPSRMQSRLLQKHLGELGIVNVRTFETIAETLAHLGDEIPHGIISAMHLDDGSGDDLFHQLRLRGHGSTFPCFLISSTASDATSKFTYPGRPRVLPKPVTKEMLSEVLKQIGTGPKH